MPREYSKAIVLVLKNELKAVKEEHGALTKANIVNWARKHPKSKLHREFDWNLRSAAEKYWLIRAGEIIRSCKVYVEIEGDSPSRRPVSIYVSVEREKVHQYEEIVEVMARKGDRTALLEQFRQDVEALERRFATYHFLASRLQLLREAIRDLDQEDQGGEVG